MSSEATASDGDPSFEERLQKMYERYRRRNLESKLTELSQTMEATILQQTLAEEFFDTTLEIDHEAKAAVEKNMKAIDREDYEAVEDQFSALKTHVDEEQTRVSNRIQELRIDRLATVRAMRRLNERVDRVNSMRLEALERLLDDWNWRPHVYTENAESLPERREEAVDYGEDMARVFAELKEKLFGPYKDTELWPLVQALLDEERLTYGDLSDHERQLLADSDLAEYVELSLS